MARYKSSPLSAAQEELKRLRFAELDATYAKQLKALSDIMRSARVSIRKLRQR
jgi:hypothetical protein